MVSGSTNTKIGRAATQEIVQRVYELRDEGQSYQSIADQVGVSRDALRKWYYEPETWSPYLDEVALERALAGDHSAYRHLSKFEYQEFDRRVEALRPGWNAEYKQGPYDPPHEGRRRFGDELWGTISRRLDKRKAAAKVSGE